MATHPSIPAWRMPWTKEPGGLLYMGSYRAYGPSFIFLLGKKAGTGGHEAWFPSWSWNKVSELPSGQVLQLGD